MYKKGIEYVLLIRLFFIAVIIGLCLTVIVRIQDDTLFTELKTLHEISYAYQAVSSSPEQVSLNYYVPQGYDLNLNEKEIEIKSIKKNELIPLTLEIAQVKNSIINLKTENGIQKVEIKKVE